MMQPDRKWKIPFCKSSEYYIHHTEQFKNIKILWLFFKIRTFAILQLVDNIHLLYESIKYYELKGQVAAISMLYS